MTKHFQDGIELIEHPPGPNRSAFHDAAAKIASAYGIIFVYDRKVFGSGTLVTVCGVYGILTAHHVSCVPVDRGWNDFSLCIRGDVPHRTDVQMTQIDHIVVGNYKRNRYEHTGPDLSLMIILDSDLLSRLSPKKSFYPLDQSSDLSSYSADTLGKLHWWASGSPAEFSEDLGIDRGETLDKFADFHAEAGFLAIEERGGFDYITLQVDAPGGSNKFPEDYGGMSGGGIWTPIMTEDHKGAKHPAGILQGVTFFQVKPQNGQSELIGHGPNSIYKKVAEKIKADGITVATASKVQ